MTYKDGTTQQTSSKPSETVFQEGTPEYYLQKKQEADEARAMKAEQDLADFKTTRAEETRKLVEQYGADIASQYQNNKAEIEEQGNKRMEATKSMMSSRGAGRSGFAVQKVDEIAANVQKTINAAKSQADLNLAIYKAKLE